jgi:hypothetical protein
MRHIVITILLIAAFVVGGGLIASVAYQAGLSTAVSTVVTESGATVVAPVTPVVAPAYGWGWGGPGWLFGFLGFLFFLFLFIGLIRFAVGGGRGGPRGWNGPGGWDRSRWEGHASEWFEERHRRAHEGTSDRPDAAAG